MREVEAGLGDDCVDSAAVVGACVASDEAFELKSSYEPLSLLRLRPIRMASSEIRSSRSGAR